MGAKRTERVFAYHQVGTESMGPEHRVALLDVVLATGRILPAVDRLDRSEMAKECFEEEGSRLEDRFEMATPRAMQALKSIARSWIRRLPEEGSRHTRFTCVDVLAGDLDRVFLSIGDWQGSFATGLVFDAADLIRRGAEIRGTDLLDRFDWALRNAVERTYRSQRDAKDAIQAAVDHVLENRTVAGEDALRALDDCTVFPGTCEITWNGPLPLDLAVGIWRGEEATPMPRAGEINPI